MGQSIINNFKWHILRLGIPILVLSFASSGAAQTTISWKLKGGDRFYVTKQNDVRQTLTHLGVDTHQSVQVTKILRYDVLQKEKDESLLLNKTIESVKVRYKGGAKRGNHKIVKALEGTRFQFTLTPAGRISDYSGWDAFLKRLKDTGRGPLAPLVEAAFSQEALQAADEMLFDITPEKAVTPGDRWSRMPAEPFGPLGSLKLHTFYALDGKQNIDGTVKITKTSTISYQPPKKIGKLFPIESGRLSSAREKGIFWFDVARGRLQKAEWERRLEGTFTAMMDKRKVTWELEHRQTVKLSVSTNAPSK